MVRENTLLMDRGSTRRYALSLLLVFLGAFLFLPSIAEGDHSRCVHCKSCPNICSETVCANARAATSRVQPYYPCPIAAEYPDGGEGYILSPYGSGRSGCWRCHKGVDISVKQDGSAVSGHAIRAMAPGTASMVVGSHWRITDPQCRSDGGCGLGVTVVHADDNWISRYCHIEAAEVDGVRIEPGTGAGMTWEVQAGDIVGYVGKTGNACTTPPHLHLEIWEKGNDCYVLKQDPETHTCWDLAGARFSEYASKAPTFDNPWGVGSDCLSRSEESAQRGYPCPVDATLGFEVLAGYWAPNKPCEGRNYGLDLVKWPEAGDAVYNGGAMGGEVKAVASGDANFHLADPDKGNWVELFHKDGWISKYLHLQDFGDYEDFAGGNTEVARGALIGHVGRTGLSAGPAHLEFQLLDPGFKCSDDSWACGEESCDPEGRIDPWEYACWDVPATDRESNHIRLGEDGEPADFNVKPPGTPKTFDEEETGCPMSFPCPVDVEQFEFKLLYGYNAPAIQQRLRTSLQGMIIGTEDEADSCRKLVHAIAPGEATYYESSPEDDGKKVVEIVHENGWKSRYIGLESLYCPPGSCDGVTSEIAYGSAIGRIGEGNDAVPGCDLHFQLFRDDAPVDPWEYSCWDLPPLDDGVAGRYGADYYDAGCAKTIADGTPPDTATVGYFCPEQRQLHPELSLQPHSYAFDSTINTELDYNYGEWGIMRGLASGLAACQYDIIGLAQCVQPFARRTTTTDDGDFTVERISWPGGCGEGFYKYEAQSVDTIPFYGDPYTATMSAPEQTDVVEEVAATVESSWTPTGFVPLSECVRGTFREPPYYPCPVEIDVDFRWSFMPRTLPGKSTRCHDAIDMYGPAGTAIRAVSDGTLTYTSGNNQACGCGAYLDHGDGYHTKYCHMQETPGGNRVLEYEGGGNYITCTTGSRTVSQGDLIGTMGKTSANGVHLHFALMKGGQGTAYAVDPEPHMCWDQPDSRFSAYASEAPQFGEPLPPDLPTAGAGGTVLARQPVNYRFAMDLEDLAPPTAVTDVEVAKISAWERGHQKVRVSWQAPTFNDQAIQDIARYEIFASRYSVITSLPEASLGGLKVGEISNPALTATVLLDADYYDTGHLNGQTYYVAVRAVDCGGNPSSELSEAVMVHVDQSPYDCSDYPHDNEDQPDGMIDFGEDNGCYSHHDPTEYNPLIECDDQVDNDRDGRIDYPFDTNCGSNTDDTEGVPPACSDGIDNDGDSLRDYGSDIWNDPGCVSPTDTSEYNYVAPPVPPSSVSTGMCQTSTGIQICTGNDGACCNGDCYWSGSCPAPPPSGGGCTPIAGRAQCNDGCDNDNDGKTDMADCGCFSIADTSEAGSTDCVISCTPGFPC